MMKIWQTYFHLIVLPSIGSWAQVIETKYVRQTSDGTDHVHIDVTPHRSEAPAWSQHR